MEPECKNEKNLLIKTMKQFKDLLTNVVSSNNLNLSNDESYISLRTFYEETECKLIDTDYFHCILGKNFENTSS